jgi:hypothetical protein
MFSRTTREGWSAWGNQTDKFTPTEKEEAAWTPVAKLHHNQPLPDTSYTEKLKLFRDP